MYDNSKCSGLGSYLYTVDLQVLPVEDTRYTIETFQYIFYAYLQAKNIEIQIDKELKSFKKKQIQSYSPLSAFIAAESLIIS